MAVTSRLKRALGLRARNTRPTVGAGGRPLTSAEIMRRQMGVSEQTDARLRKTLVRSLVGPQMSRKVDSLVLPLELLRHLKPADFFDAGEHRAWQLRQLRVLEAGLVSHPSVPLDRGNASASALRDTVRSAELQTRPVLDARALSAVVAALCRRSVDACRWADGYPLNVHLYLTLLRAVFDARDETVVLDEVDELMELIRKTWNVLGLNDTIHNVCFTWLFLEKYVTTGETEPDLLSAALAMLEQVRDDARRQAEAGTLEAAHLRVLSATLASMHSWAEEKLLDYHESFGDDQGAGGSIGAMENAVSLAVLAAAMLSQDVPSSFAVAVAAAGGDLSSARSPSSFSAREREIVERYIKSSVRRAFTRVRIYVALDYIYIRIQHISCWRMHAAYIYVTSKHVWRRHGWQLHETGTAEKMDSMIVEVDEDPCETLMYVASQTKELARLEKEVYDRVVRQWHPCPTAVAAATLHGCFGALLKRYVSRMAACGLSSETVRVLHAASKLDKWLLQMASEDDPPPDQPPMTPYDVDSIIFGLVKGWMDERLKVGDECLRRAQEAETWNPRSKAEPYAQSAVDLMKLAKVTVDEMLEIQVASACKEELLQRLVDGIDHLVHQYAMLLASCGAVTTWHAMMLLQTCMHLYHE